MCCFFQFIEAIQFIPRLKGVLSRVLPILGNVRDVHRPIFANGMAILSDFLGSFRSKLKLSNARIKEFMRITSYPGIRFVVRYLNWIAVCLFLHFSLQI